MNLKGLYLLSNGIIIVILLTLLGSCSTPGTTPKTEEISPSPKEVRLAEFILGPGDKVEILVYRHDSLKMTSQIDPSGKITYPLIGDVQASGLSIFQLRDRIRDRLAEYIIDPQVSVGVLAVQSQKVYVIGEVTKPGVFNLDTPKSVVEAISQAGGYTKDAKSDSVVVIRGDRDQPQLIKVDIKSALKGELTQNIQLKGGDIVFIPSKTIADVSRFSAHLWTILNPILLGIMYY